MYALTVYFGRIFHQFETRKLMYWLGTLNNLEGKLEIIETCYFSKTNDNPRRRGARIVAFEGNQKFLDSLHRYPRDYPFSIRFGGNVYITGGDRYIYQNAKTFPHTYHKSERNYLKPYPLVQFICSA